MNWDEEPYFDYKTYNFNSNYNFNPKPERNRSSIASLLITMLIPAFMIASLLTVYKKGTEHPMLDQKEESTWTAVMNRIRKGEYYNSALRNVIKENYGVDVGDGGGNDR